MSVFKNDNVRALWRQSKPIVWAGNYWMVSFERDDRSDAFELAALSSEADHYVSVICDQHEVALILPDSVWREHQECHHVRDAYGPLSCLTLDVPLDITVAGYLQPVVERMAEAGVSVVPQCALIYDHILVHEKDAAKAVEIVSQLRVEADSAETK